MKQCIFFILLGTISCYAKDDITKEVLSEISNSMFYACDEAKHQLDSLRNSFSDEELVCYQAYFDYCDAFYYFQNYEYDTAFTLSNEALFTFINKKDEDWEARCLLLIAFVAETVRLTDEALEAYSEAILIAESKQVLGLSYLGLARCQKRNNLDWSDSYNKGVNQLALCDSYELGLYSRYIKFWFYPNSSSLVDNCNAVGKSYEDIKYYKNAALAYKLVALYYLKQEQVLLADHFIHKSIWQLKCADNYSLVSLSSMLFVNGKVQLASGNLTKAYDSFKACTFIYDSIGQNHQNYHIYRYLIRLDSINEDYKNALHHSSMALKSYRSMTVLKVRWAREVRIVLEDRQVLIRKLLSYKKRTASTIVCLVIILLIISTLVIAKSLKKRRALEKRLSAAKLLMKDSIMEVKKKRFSKYVKNSSSMLEKQVSKHLSNNVDMLENINMDSVDMILLIERHMPILSEREKKCVSLIAMGCKNEDIAELLSIKVDSVKTYRARIRKKLNMENSKANLRKEVLRILKIDFY